MTIIQVYYQRNNMKDEVDINTSKAKKRLKALTKLGLQRKISQYVNELTDFLINEYDMIDVDVAEIGQDEFVEYFQEDLDSQLVSGQILDKYYTKIMKEVRIKIKKYQKDLLSDED